MYVYFLYCICMCDTCIIVFLSRNCYHVCEYYRNVSGEGVGFHLGHFMVVDYVTLVCHYMKIML